MYLHKTTEKIIFDCAQYCIFTTFLFGESVKHVHVFIVVSFVYLHVVCYVQWMRPLIDLVNRNMRAGTFNVFATMKAISQFLRTRIYRKNCRGGHAWIYSEFDVNHKHIYMES